jgi:hypothetical protein
MTTIRRIPTSKIDGNNSNATDTNEIRPYGEIAVYVGDNNKLELLMFDGVRTHLKSKVLNKGTFYGGDADSGDGAGLDTIKLVPDEELRRNGSDQYVIIDPTEPDHIHIRAGGTIDNSSADLFLGGELNHVRVSDSGNTVTISTDAGEGNTKNWTFNTDGSSTTPTGLTFQNQPFEGVTGTFVTQTIDQYLVLLAQGTGLAAIGWTEDFLNPGRGASIDFNPNNEGGVRIATGDLNTTAYFWTFDNNGNLTLPTGVTNNGRITNNDGISLAVDTNFWVFDNTGDLTFPSGGNITFDSSATSYVYGVGGIEFADGSTQTTAHESTSGSWSLSPGANTVSFTVDPNATYTMWVNGNIPNGIVKWNATISLSNPNVPALGYQYGWYYDVGNQLVLTSIPNQIVGTNGSISTATVVTTASNVLTFGITNNSGSSQVVNWGYTKI